MFTGIVTSVGEVVALERGDGVLRATIDSDYDPASAEIGASVSHNGCCLTLTTIAPGPRGMRHTVDVAAESLALTTLGAWQVGDRVNLERSLRAGDELGGHLVMGHVDGVGDVLRAAPDGEGLRLVIQAPAELTPLIAPKGAICIDGVSLTVNEVEGSAFGVLIIPHTLTVTTLGKRRAGDKVNLEADSLARYALRILSARST